ncbi:survival motor neuron protein [Nephila pilipes]|uniref:Survival motor neuron protein n=1 Tax=Nephila pilipes TaxID=299642 RepID=A0A8X6NSP2_NEPPI|nr:survival motor neuron protein [Nephila pilipes]
MRELQDFQNYDWDDTELVRAYNGGFEKLPKMEKKTSKDNKGSLTKKWKVGNYCSAKYSVDGIYYEAKILGLNADFCNVEFLGYHDNENVPLCELEESAGKRARRKQIKIAAAVANLPHSSGEEESELDSVNESVSSYATKDERENCRENSSVKKREAYNLLPEETNYPGPAPVSAPGPYAQQFHSPYYAPPPVPTNMHHVPPPLPEIGNLSNVGPMLMAWYWAGYYSGLYAAQEGRAHVAAPGPHAHDRGCHGAHNCCPRAHNCCYH